MVVCENCVRTGAPLNYYTFKFRHLLLSLTPTQRLSNKALNLPLSYVLYFAHFDGCRVFDLVMMLRGFAFCC